MKQAISWLLLVALTGCEPSALPETGHNAPQSAIEVKSSAQALSLPALSNARLADHQAIAEAFAQKQSHVWLEGYGVVKKLLPDDQQGAKHQRFLVSISPEQTLLVAHNIDLAPRVEHLAVGDMVEFRGEYIYNPKGGIMHWTHHDPQGHQHGWITHQHHTYE